ELDLQAKIRNSSASAITIIKLAFVCTIVFAILSGCCGNHVKRCRSASLTSPINLSGANSACVPLSASRQHHDQQRYCHGQYGKWRPLCVLQPQRHGAYAAANKEDEEAQNAEKDQIRKKQSALGQLAAQLNENARNNKIAKQFVILVG